VTDFIKMFFILKNVMSVWYKCKCNFIYRWKKKYWLSCTDFHKTHKCSTALGADLLYKISPKSDNKCGKHWYKFIYAHK